MDRPSRKTKVVNYCEAKDFDEDEDFACIKAPPSKKAREDVKQQECKKSSSKPFNQETDPQPTLSQKNSRLLDNTLYERHLEAAITLSLLNNTGDIKDGSPISKGNSSVQLPVDDNTDPSSLHLSNCSVDGAVLASTPVRSPTAAKLAPRRPASSSTVSMSKPAASESPAGGRIPKWNPPGQIGRSPRLSQSPAVKSPGQGLRLGLSRLVRVKPLHPGVASH
uniref:RAD51 interacting motif domain-containing protein n=1 Tax=Monopterus albus TaxID=43700 RepID=A0A3Q3JMW9_MONAL